MVKISQIYKYFSPAYRQRQNTSKSQEFQRLSAATCGQGRRYMDGAEWLYVEPQVQCRTREVHVDQAMPAAEMRYHLHGSF
jgi:hypothetical protein